PLTHHQIRTSFHQIVSLINPLQNHPLSFYHIASARINLHTPLQIYQPHHKILKIQPPIVQPSFIPTLPIKSNISMHTLISQLTPKYPQQ
ncbi:PTS-dependent dihydroxyacetone kinase phosphotransferase subunit DhaM, partial [Staphylococcus epidermidis]|uniref:PTS-dependent dihydroxyacetone kinase phosphotransferase subunit DhaM n=1 Tax=Staphylococcus epidermidis TaxID=1282 RepID=UPI001C92FFA2